MVQEKRLNHEDHMSRQNAKNERQSEDARSFSTEAGPTNEVRYEYAPTANMRNGSALSSIQSPVVHSDVRTLKVLIRYNDGMKIDPQSGTHRPHASEDESVGIVRQTTEEARQRAARPDELPGAA
jgi:hypothetical protein